jgi:hypothetical protein
VLKLQTLMSLRTLTAILIAALLAARTSASSLAVAQVESSATSSEQVETGRMRLPGGTEVVYRIRLLPLASFPALPAAVAAQLEQRKCMVPQTYAAREPENVMHGSLEKKGSDDWAVLCSVDGATTLYVFFQSQLSAPIVLRHQRDAEWLGSEVLGAYGSAWGISRRGPSQIHPAKELAAKHVVFDHDGIEDAFIDKSSSTHYFQDGSWTIIESPN